MLMLCRTDPSATVAGSSKEAGPSVSVTGEVTGLVGVAEDEVVTEVAGGAEPGEGRGKLRGSILMPGLFIGGPVGESTSSACKVMSERCQSDVRTMSERCQNDVRVMSE